MLKKFFAYFKLVFVALFCTVTLCNCGAPGVSPPSSPEPPPLVVPPPPGDFNDTALGRQIRQDYYEMLLLGGYHVTFDSVWIAGYYGTYNDCVAVVMRRIGPSSPLVLVWTTIVGESLFAYSSVYASRIIAWKEGLFYELQDAYNQGLLTNEDTRNIAHYAYGDDADRMNLENHAGLRLDRLRAITQSYFVTYLEPYFPKSSRNNILFVNYYGSYEYFEDPSGRINDCVAVMITTKYDEYADEAWEATVAGTVFRYNNGNKILLWKSDQGFYELQEAYDIGLLTVDDIQSIAYYHENGKAIYYDVNISNLGRWKYWANQNE